MLACAVLVRALYERMNGRSPWEPGGPMAAGALIALAFGVILVVRWAWRWSQRQHPGRGIARLRQWLSETPD